MQEVALHACREEGSKGPDVEHGSVYTPTCSHVRQRDQGHEPADTCSDEESIFAVVGWMHAGDQSSRPVTELRSTTNNSASIRVPGSRVERINKHMETHVGVRLDYWSRFNWKLWRGALIRD